jgi:hypothetical protein
VINVTSDNIPHFENNFKHVELNYFTHVELIFDATRGDEMKGDES